MKACRDCLSGLLKKGGASNPGLVLQRLLTVQKKKNDSSEDAINARKDLIEAAQAAAGKAQDPYRKAFQLRQEIFRKLEENPGSPRVVKRLSFKTDGRLIIGLGGESPLETGLTLLSPYGLPVIPGSALKGLAAHYCGQVWGEEDNGYKDIKKDPGKPEEPQDPEESKEPEEPEEPEEPAGRYFKALFGTTEDAGHIVFHDAWIWPESLKGKNGIPLVEDVMTPHHGDYYESAGKKGFPTDFDEPKPVTFLSVSGKFEVILECDNAEKGKEWLERVADLLTAALANWGIGGKTSSGYGRMKRLERPQTAVLPVAEGPRPGDQVKVFRDKNNKKGNPQVYCGKIRCRLESEGEPPIPEKTEGEARIVKVTKTGSETEYVITFEG